MAEACMVEPQAELICTENVSEPQAAFLQSDGLFRGLFGGRGSGKTHAGCLAALLAAGERKCLGMVCSPTYDMLRDDVLPLLLRILEPVILHHYKSEKTISLINGSEIKLRSLDRPEHRRGPNISWLWCDEAAQIALETWLILIGSLREGGRLGRAYVTSTPRGKSNWLYEKWVVSDDPDYVFWHAPTQTNIATSQTYKDMMVRNYGVGHWGKQEIEGAFVDPEGSVFQRHWFQVAEPANLPPFDIICRGWDLATSTNTKADYSAGVKIGLTADSDIYILDVIRQQTEWPDTRRIIIQTALMDGPECQIKVEKVAFQLAALQELIREPVLLRYAVSGAETEGRDKLSHALPIASRAQAGKVHMVRGAWNDAYLDELCSFTGDGKTHDDQVDGTTIAARAFVNIIQPKVTFL
jgi:predicted phage terminase large subunit-like protein